MVDLDKKADEVEELLKEQGPMIAREVQYKIPNLSWINTLKILKGDDRFVRDGSKRYHLTAESE